MRKSPRIPLVVWRLMSRLNRRMLSRYGPQSKIASRVLVLTTIGRRSGRPRLTPLQYEEIEGIYYVASARGTQADWYCNLIRNPKVEVQVGDTCFSTIAKPMTDPGQVADFIEIRLKRHPYFIGALLSIEGLPRKYSRSDLDALSGRLAIVVLQPPKTEPILEK